MVYLVEDDENIRRLVEYALQNNKIEAKGFARPRDFWSDMKKRVPELIILDIMLPEEDGLEILKKLRSFALTKGIPVIMLTAKDSEYDKVTGLDLGADDYIAKPFGMMELISRIKAVLRRTQRESGKTVEYTVGKLYVCPQRHIVKVDGKDISLSLKEYELLCQLLEAGGNVLNRDQLFSKVWGDTFDGESRTIDVHIRKLRQKLGESSDCIETVKGIGYKIGGIDIE